MTSTLSGGTRGIEGQGRLKRRIDAAGRLVGMVARSVAPSVDEELGRRAPRPVEPVRPKAGVIEVVVGEGEGVVDVAARFGVSTASLLALNGLGWHAQVQPGQTVLVKPAAEPPVRTQPVAAELHRHRVADGETVSRIAERHGVATAAVLLANGLSRGSAVRAGQQLVIPVPNLRRSGPDVVALTGEMRANARAVVEAGRSLGVPDDGIVIALAAAMQDSSLHNLGFGEADAVGLFQQRPSAGWGDEAALLDPRRAALAFFGGPGSGVVAPAAGLLDVGGWEFMSVGEAAAAVQRGAAAAAYGKWERCAREWLRDLERDQGR